MRKFYIILILLALVLPSRAAYLLIPMDITQTNHLKAYGVAYWVLQREVEISWLLNYRGGSYLIPFTRCLNVNARCVTCHTTSSLTRRPMPSLPKSLIQASTWTR